jgi:hypothetical protein
MKICKNCRQLFEPALQPGPSDKFADEYYCSWHPGQMEHLGTNTRGDWEEYYKWSCCGTRVIGAIIKGSDYPPRRSPGCTRGNHIPDPELSVDPNLAKELHALQERLREIEAKETKGESIDSNVFISYSHRDSSFVDQLTRQFESDQVTYWRDVKDLLVGDVIDRTISQGIQAHALFLVVLSPASLHSSWVSRELDEASHEAVEGRKILLPVVANGLNMQDVPPRLRRFKCADFNQEFNPAYSLLKRSIDAHLRRLRDNAI